MDTHPSVSPAPTADGPVFVLGERSAALQLVQALGETSALFPMPANRLLPHLLSAADRWKPFLVSPTGVVDIPLRAAGWYGDVQAALARASGKRRTVEFSGLPILRLCELFPAAQFLVVRRSERAVRRTRPLPALGQQRILEITADDPTSRDSLELALAFLGETARTTVLDLSDTGLIGAKAPPLEAVHQL